MTKLLINDGELYEFKTLLRGKSVEELKHLNDLVNNTENLSSLFSSTFNTLKRPNDIFGYSIGISVVLAILMMLELFSVGFGLSLIMIIWVVSALTLSKYEVILKETISNVLFEKENNTNVNNDNSIEKWRNHYKELKGKKTFGYSSYGKTKIV